MRLILVSSVQYHELQIEFIGSAMMQNIDPSASKRRTDAMSVPKSHRWNQSFDTAWRFKSREIIRIQTGNIRWLRTDQSCIVIDVADQCTIQSYNVFCFVNDHRFVLFLDEPSMWRTRLGLAVFRMKNMLADNLPNRPLPWEEWSNSDMSH